MKTLGTRGSVERITQNEEEMKSELTYHTQYLNFVMKWCAQTILKHLAEQ